jgi:hypothetical protein
MSTVEELLERDIAAVTGGVIVSESDLQVARDEIERRVVSRQQRARRRMVVAAAAAALTIPALGYLAFHELGNGDRSAPPAHRGPVTHPQVDADADFLTGSPPSSRLVDGLWRVDGDQLLIRFSGDGTMRFDNAGTLYSDPAVTGTYAIKGGLITISIGTGPTECVGQQFAVRAAISAEGEMHAVHTQPAAAGCSPSRGERWVLQQVLPTYNADLSGLDVPTHGDWRSPRGPTSLYGDWMAEVTDPLWPLNTGGLVLEIAPDGTYAVAADNLVLDRGRWTFDSARSRLAFVSSAGSRSCDPGDHVVLDRVEHLVTGTTAMRAAVEQDTCGQGWTSHAWILLPHEEG